MTSQSIQIVRLPKEVRSTTDRNERPMRRWISWVRPPTLPAADSRGVRVKVDRGIIAYSEVTQPCSEFLRNLGTSSSILAVQITFVFPISIKTEPSGCFKNRRVILTGRISL